MTENWPHLTAAALGIVAGFVASMPGGPVNATLLGESASKGLKWALFVGLGAVVMEALYCAAAFAGFAGLFESRWVRATMELVSFLLMLWLGIRYLRGVPMPGENRGVALVEHRFHPHTAFWTGFLRVLGNPGILLLWITVTATLSAREWLHGDWPSRWLFVGGVSAGAFLWFLILAWGVTRGHGRISSTALRRLSQTSGILLLAIAAAVGIRLVRLMAERGA